MRIFVTNDDGIEAPGIKVLINQLKKHGEVTVVAPDKPMSGVGHAITMRTTISVKEYKLHEGVRAYSCSGTPADCVKYGIGNLFKDQLPDLLVSGINHGSNASVNMIYSGTVAGAVEGCLYGIPSIAISSLSHDENEDLSACVDVLEKVIDIIKNKKLPRFVLLNVNVPVVSIKDLKGYKICRQSLGYWKEEFIDEINNNGDKSYWLKGKFVCEDQDESTDIWALENGYASVVPVYLDLTSYVYLNELKLIENYEN